MSTCVRKQEYSGRCLSNAVLLIVLCDLHLTKGPGTEAILSVNSSDFLKQHNIFERLTSFSADLIWTDNIDLPEYRRDPLVPPLPLSC